INRDPSTTTTATGAVGADPTASSAGCDAAIARQVGSRYPNAPTSTSTAWVVIETYARRSGIVPVGADLAIDLQLTTHHQLHSPTATAPRRITARILVVPSASRRTPVGRPNQRTVSTAPILAIAGLATLTTVSGSPAR